MRERSGFFRLGNASSVVPRKRSLPSGESTVIVGTRLGQSIVFTEYRSGCGVSLPSPSTDISRIWSGPNVCTTKSVLLEGAYASDLAPPLVAFPVRFTSSTVRRPSLFTAKLQPEFSPPLLPNRKRRPRDRITLPPP